MEHILLFFSLKYRGNWDRIYLALEQKESVLKKELNAAKNLLTADYLTLIDSHFPANLKQCGNPPFVLYTWGNQNLLDNYDTSIGLIGGKQHEEYGSEIVCQLMDDWSPKRCLIVIGSNMKFLNLIMNYLATNEGQLIVVVHESLVSFQKKYQKLIEKFKKENLLIISEFYQSYDPNFDNQSLYYRLLVGLSRRLVFVQISKKEDNFALFKHGLREEREIFSVPEPVNSPFDGSNFILQHRGKLVERGDDVFPSPTYH